MKFKNRMSRSAWLLPALILASAAAVMAQLPANTYVNSRQFNFAYQTGTPTTVQPQTLQVISETPRTYTITPQQSSGTTISWLTVNGSLSTFTGTTNDFISIGVNPSGLAPGVYNGNLHYELSGVPAATIDIPVALRVSAAPQISIPRSFLNIQGQIGTQVAEIIPVNSTSATPIAYQASVSQYYPSGGPQWLSVSPASGNTNPVGTITGNVTLTANLAGLSSGLYYAVVNFRETSSGQGGDVSLPVILTVRSVSTISANPAAVNFAFQASNLTATPNVKPLAIVGSEGAVSTYTAGITGDSRITISKSSTGQGTSILTGTTPETLYVIVNQAGLAAGAVVEATITVAGTGTAQNSVTIPVRVNVTNAPLIIANPDAVSFAYTLGSTVPQSQTISVTGTSVVQYTVAEAEVSGGDWLTVATGQGSTPGQISVSLNATRLQQLASGTYTANITITGSSAGAAAGNSPLTIPVTLTISGTTLLTVDPAALEFSGELNGRVPDRKTFVVKSTDGTNQNYTLRVEPASAWLVLDKNGGATGALGDIVTVTIDPTKVSAAGKYEADIVLTPQSTTAGAVGQRVRVTFNVTTTTSATATPARIDANQVGAAVPNPVTVRIGSAVPGVTFTARAEAVWLSVTPTQGTTNQDIVVTFNSGNLTPGTYDSAITILPSGATPLSIPVRLVVTSAATLNLSQNTLNIAHIQGTTAPAGVTVGLTSSGTPIAFTAAATSTGNWLSVSPTSGTTTAAGGAATNLTITANPAGLAPGTYTGTVAVTPAGGTAQNITVTLVVTAATPPVLREVQSAARNEQTLIAPGMILQLKGTNLGPATGVIGRVTNGVVDTTLSEVRILFDGVPAPVLFARQDQINTVAPYFLFGRTSTRVQIEYRGQRSDPIEYRVVDTAPGIFTADSTGRGAGAILNQNNTVNTPTNPARRGEVIVIYATGEGQVSPAGSDGRIVAGTVNSLPRPVLPVTVRINGQAVPAENIFYAGAAPGLVAGALQMNVKIPETLNITGLTAVPVDFLVGTTPSQSGVTVSVIP